MSDFLTGIVGFLQQLTALQVVAGAVLLVAAWYVRGAAVVLSQLGIENRKLRRGIQGYEQLEQQHHELTQENRERNQFHSTLPGLISRLGDERTVAGICRELLDFTAAALGASEASLFVVDAGTLVLKGSIGVSAAHLKIRIGEGRIGAVAQYRRLLAAEDFANLDSKTREAIVRAPSRIDTAIAAPLVAHGQLIAVLNVGGTVRSSSALRKELLSVLANLGATALESQLNFERLEREATTDGLTGLSNVKNFKEKFRQELSRAARYGRPLSVFLMDVDHFKIYNDQNGHPAGDQCLRATAEVLRTQSRITDLPARYGGEEFAVLLPETDAAGALVFAEKIRAAVAARDFPFREKQPLRCVSISGGVASFPDHGKDLETLIAAADRVLYQCKEGGRNRVAAAAPGGAAEGRPGVRSA